MLGAEISTTVGTEEKRQFLMDNFNIPADHILDSHSISFTTRVILLAGIPSMDCVVLAGIP
jgi:hypothetical protein